MSPIRFFAAVALLCASTQAFSNSAIFKTNINRESALGADKNDVNMSGSLAKFATAAVVSAGLLFPGQALAGEYGREVEAPTLFTGETTMICVKRGPLGACRETVKRTVENDNDKANSYFKDPQDSMKDKYSAYQLQKIDVGENTKTVASSEGNELIEKLRQQSVDNKDRNDKIIRAKTLQNDMGASFGPLSDQVAILNSDGETFSLLKGAQAMRLKKAGYIKDKRFVTQPSQQVIDEAYDAPEGSGIGGFIGGIKKGIFGGEE